MASSRQHNTQHCPVWFTRLDRVSVDASAHACSSVPTYRACTVKIATHGALGASISSSVQSELPRDAGTYTVSCSVLPDGHHSPSRNNTNIAQRTISGIR